MNVHCSNYVVFPIFLLMFAISFQSASLRDEKVEGHALADAVGPSSVLTETSCSSIVENGNRSETNNRGEKAEEYALPDAVGPSGVFLETGCSKVVENGFKELETNDRGNWC